MFWLNRCNSFFKALVYVSFSLFCFIDDSMEIVLICLVSGLPMEAGLVGLGRLSRAMSMEDADRPRRSSVLSPSSPSTASPPLVGSPPKN